VVRKISKFDATRRQILRLKCTKFDFRLTALPQTPYLYLRGLLLGGGRRYREERGRKRRGEKDKGNERGREGKGRGREGREGEGKGFAGPLSNCFLRACGRCGVFGGETPHCGMVALAGHLIT